jgi:predicted nucleic acid-binding protein
LEEIVAKRLFASLQQVLMVLTNPVAAAQSGAAILYSEDLALKQNYGPVRVINPLTGAGET